MNKFTSPIINETIDIEKIYLKQSYNPKFQTNPYKYVISNMFNSSELKFPVALRKLDAVSNPALPHSSAQSSCSSMETETPI